MRRSLIAAAMLVLLSGCQLLPRQHLPLNYSRYHDPAFRWNAVGRVVLLPLLNETDLPQATAEMREALSAELQRLGLFEVVVAPREPYEHLSQKIRENGRFNEAELLELANCFRADVILLGTLTQYRPYQRPRIGLVLQAISPDTGKVIASVDGLWDSTSHPIAQRAQQFYSRKCPLLHEACDSLFGNLDTAYASELVLDSPHLFRRFVAFEAVVALVLKMIPLECLPPVVDAKKGPFHPKPAFGPNKPTGLLGHFKRLCQPDHSKDKVPEGKKFPEEDAKAANKAGAPPAPRDMGAVPVRDPQQPELAPAPRVLPKQRP